MKALVRVLLDEYEQEGEGGPPLARTVDQRLAFYAQCAAHLLEGCRRGHGGGTAAGVGQSTAVPRTSAGPPDTSAAGITLMAADGVDHALQAVAEERHGELTQALACWSSAVASIPAGRTPPRWKFEVTLANTWGFDVPAGRRLVLL